MYWQEKTDKDTFAVPDDVVDLVFRIECTCLPLDHAYTLSSAIRAALPWFEGEALTALHLIHGAESGNGWFRPEDPETELLHLSRRARLTLRVPKHRIDDARELTGQALNIGPYSIDIGEASTKPLSAMTTLFSRHVAAEADGDEEAFIEQSVRQLKELEIQVRKLLCGRLHHLATPNGKIHIRSLMLADLDVGESVRLQQHGLGQQQKIGCGVFIPHKSIKSVRSDDDD